MSKKMATSSRSRRQFPTSPSPEKRSPAEEIIASNVDLLTEILLRLPAKPLIKFKCVSKHWLSLISHSNFAIDHNRRNPSPLVSGMYLNPNWRLTHPVNGPVLPISFAGHRCTSLPTLSFLDGGLSTSRTTLCLTNSSNGLMLCFHTDGYFLVCNLTTQKFKQLPKLRGILYEWCLHYDPSLVFDPTKSPYYKVVLVSGSHHPYASRLAIYASECASWKYVDVVVPRIGTSRRSAIWNGEIIWMWCKGRENRSRHEHVYSQLDMDTEKLTETRVPLDPNLSKYMIYFGECGGRLLLIQLPSHDAAEFSILEMDRNSFCWIVEDRVDLTSLILPTKSSCVISVISVVQGTDKNDLALVFYNRGKVISCNLECRTMKVICGLSPREITSYARSELYRFCIQFIESLSPV